MGDFKKNEDERGALWIKSSARGEFFSGIIDGEAVVVFRNDKKAPGSKAPDYLVLKAKPRDQAPASHGPVVVEDDIPF